MEIIEALSKRVLAGFLRIAKDYNPTTELGKAFDLSLEDEAAGKNKVREEATKYMERFKSDSTLYPELVSTIDRLIDTKFESRRQTFMHLLPDEKHAVNAFYSWINTTYQGLKQKKESPRDVSMQEGVGKPGEQSKERGESIEAPTQHHDPEAKAIQSETFQLLLQKADQLETPLVKAAETIVSMLDRAVEDVNSGPTSKHMDKIANPTEFLYDYLNIDKHSLEAAIDHLGDLNKNAKDPVQHFAKLMDAKKTLDKIEHYAKNFLFGKGKSPSKNTKKERQEAEKMGESLEKETKFDVWHKHIKNYHEMSGNKEQAEKLEEHRKIYYQLESKEKEKKKIEKQKNETNDAEKKAELESKFAELEKEVRDLKKKNLSGKTGSHGSKFWSFRKSLNDQSKIEGKALEVGKQWTQYKEEFDAAVKNIEEFAKKNHLKSFYQKALTLSRTSMEKLYSKLRHITGSRLGLSKRIF